MGLARCFALLSFVLLMASALAYILPDSDDETGPKGPRGMQEPGTRAQVPNMDQNISYAIITPSQFKPLLEPLKEMKTQKGVKTEIYELHNGSLGILDVYNADEYTDDAERIHEFLRDLDQMNPDLQWVLLVGDTDLLPSRRMYLNGSVSDNYAEVSDGIKQYAFSDYYYAGLNSTWNVNPNIVFGEEGETDYTPEVYVGRLPVNTLTEAQRAISNIIDYEVDPEPGYWYRSFLLCGAVMDTPNLMDYPANRELEYKWYKDNGYEVTQKLQAMIPSQMVNFSLYDYGRLQGGNYSPFYDTLNHTNARNYWDLGNSLVNFASHGYLNGNALLEYYSDGDRIYGPQTTFPFFDYNDAYECQNGQRLPLLYASACGVGNFSETDDTNLERLLYAPQGGAIGVIAGSSEDTWRCEFEENDSSYGNWWLDQEFWRLVLSGSNQPGKALYQSKVNYGLRIADPNNPHKDYPYKTYYKTNRLAYNLLGDPEVPIWTDVPQAMSVSYPEPYHINNQSLSISIKDPDGAPVKNATVCIYGGGVYITARSDTYGNVNIPLALDSTQVLNMTVTAHNFLWYESKINVISVCDLTYNISSFAPDIQYPLVGQSVGISVEVLDLGPIAVSNISVDFYLGDPFAAGKLIGSFSNQSLGANGKRTYEIAWSVKNGTNGIYVWVDSLNRILEINEENNLGHITIRGNINVYWFPTAPIVMPEDTRLSTDLSANINLMYYANDPDSWPQPIGFHITNVSDPHCNVSLFTLPSGAVYLEAIPEHDWFGTVNVTVMATDGPTQAQAVVSIMVTNVEDPPRFTDLQPMTVFEGTPYSLYLSVYDSDSDNVSLSCQNNTLNLTATDLGNKTLRIDLTPTNAEVGRHTVSILATDESNNTAQQYLVVEVKNVNSPPFFIEPSANRPFKLKVGSDFATHIKAQDLDLKDQLRYYDNTDMFDINSSTGLIEFSPHEEDRGEHIVTIWAYDANGSKVSMNLTFDVQANSTPPSDTYAIMIIFVLCIIVITAISLFFYRKRKMSQKSDMMTEEVEPREKERRMSIEEWSRLDSDIAELTEMAEGPQGPEGPAEPPSDEAEPPSDGAGSPVDEAAPNAADGADLKGPELAIAKQGPDNKDK